MPDAAPNEQMWSRRYWRIAFRVWCVTIFVFAIAAIAAIVAGPTWAEVVFFAVTSALFFLALWWSIDTMRPYWLGEGPSAKELLDRRLARGEISEEQYDRLKSRLAAGGSLT